MLEYLDMNDLNENLPEEIKVTKVKKIKKKPTKPVRKYRWEVDLKDDTGRFLTTITYRNLKEVAEAYPRFSASQIYDYAARRPEGLQYRTAVERFKNFEFRRIKQEDYIPLKPRVKKAKDGEKPKNTQT